MATITDLQDGKKKDPGSEAGRDWRMPLTISREDLLDAKGSDADFRRTIYGIFTMTVNFDRIRERMATALGLSGIQYHILMVVAELSLEMPVTISVVADRLHTSGAYVTMETKKLMRRGFLDKRPNPEDGRSVILELTPDGKEAIDAFALHLRAINDELFDGMGPETFAQFGAIVDHMCRTSARAADMAEQIAREHTEIGGKVAGSVWR